MTIEQSAREERQVRVSKVGDRVFLGLSRGAGVFILVTLAGVALFLFREALPALQADATEFRDSDTFLQYVGPLVFGTVLASVLAVVLAAPLAVAVALYLTHYAPKRLARTFGQFVDLLAAIPSVVFGLWGIAFLAPLLARHVYPVLHENFGWIPLFAGPVVPSGRSMLTAGIVLAVMILPLITAISREAFSRTPRLHEEASLALGATRWEMIRQAVLPFGRSGIISAAMLGLGRALGETMAVLMVISPGFLINFYLLQPGQHQSIAANIASQFPEASGLGVDVLIASGLMLFILTFGVNLLARWVIARRAEFSGAN